MHNVLRRGDRGQGGRFLGIVPHQQQDQACHDIFVLSDSGHQNTTKKGQQQAVQLCSSFLYLLLIQLYNAQNPTGQYLLNI